MFIWERIVVPGRADTNRFVLCQRPTQDKLGEIGETYVGTLCNVALLCEGSEFNGADKWLVFSINVAAVMKQSC